MAKLRTPAFARASAKLSNLRIVTRTAASQAWLTVLLPPAPDERAIPASVYNVAAQLLVR